MGLVKDMFRKTHWNMYSPDRKARQMVYMSVCLPLKYKEVECDDIYRAMIHYMVCYAKVPTDTFVDVYGEFGLSALFCANGYEHEIWVEDKKLLQIWKDTIISKRNCNSIYNNIQKIQEELKDKSLDWQRERISELLQIYWLNNFLDIRKPEEEIDKIEFVTGIFIANSFSPEYWLDSNLVIEEKQATEWLDEKRISKERIERFIGMTKKEFLYFADKYRNMKIFEVNRTAAIHLLKNKESYAKECKEKKEREFLENYHKLLYIDAPKYMSEYKRKNFDSFQHMNLVEMLKNYDGEWILTWKNDIQKKYAKGTAYSPLNYRHKKGWEEELEAQARIDAMYANDIEETEMESSQKAPDMHDILKAIQQMDTKEKEPLYVFKYRKGTMNDLGNVVFITNIQFPKIKTTEFFRRYFPKEEAKGAFVRETYANFYRYTKSSDFY